MSLKEKGALLLRLVFSLFRRWDTEDFVGSQDCVITRKGTANRGAGAACLSYLAGMIFVKRTLSANINFLSIL